MSEEKTQYKTDTDAFASLTASLIELARDGGESDSNDIQDWLCDAGVLEATTIKELPCCDGCECADVLSEGDTCFRITARGQRAETIARTRADAESEGG